MTDTYEKLVSDLAYYSEMRDTIYDRISQIRYDLCPCCGGGGRPDVDREDFPDTEEGTARYARALEAIRRWDQVDAEDRQELANLRKEEAEIEAHIEKLEELQKIMLDNGNRRKLAVLARIMKKK